MILSVINTIIIGIFRKLCFDRHHEVCDIIRHNIVSVHQILLLTSHSELGAVVFLEFGQADLCINAVVHFELGIEIHWSIVFIVNFATSFEPVIHTSARRQNIPSVVSGRHGALSIFQVCA